MQCSVFHAIYSRCPAASMTMCWSCSSLSVFFLHLGRAQYTVTELAAHSVTYLVFHSASPYPSSLAVGMLWAKVKVAHIHCSCHAVWKDTIIVSRSQLGGSAWFTCDVSLLVVQDHILVFHVTWNYFQKTCSVIIRDIAVKITDLYLLCSLWKWEWHLYFPSHGTIFNHNVFWKYFCFSFRIYRQMCMMYMKTHTHTQSYFVGRY